MSKPTTIDDPDDPRVTEYRALNDAALRRSIEGDRICIAEGALVVERLLGSDFDMRSALISDQRWPSIESLHDVLLTHRAPVYLASRRVMSEIAGFDIHRGVLAAATRPPLEDVSVLLEDATVVAVLEGINDHENMGVIFRNADALGVDAVLLDPTCCDPLYRRAIRVSMGAVFDMPFARLPSLGALTGFTVVALTPDGETSLDSVGAPRVAILLGAEGRGLSQTALTASDVRVRIPMRPYIDSLGVASAAAIAFHHFGRDDVTRY